MSTESSSKKVIRDFKLTSLSLANKNTIYLLAGIIAFFGFYTYRSLNKELFPEIYFPTILVQTVYPGNPPIDIENLVTRPIEKELESAKGVKKVTSTSLQDASMVMVEFNYDVEIRDAKQEVKDAVDKAKRELPNDLLEDPQVIDIDFAEFPIININLSGDFSLEELKRYAEYLEDKIEALPEISKVNIQGGEEREIIIDVDVVKMEALGLAFYEIENAIKMENVSMSGGDIKLGKTRRSIRVVGEFKNMDEIRNIMVKNEDGKNIYLKDVADVVDGFAEKSSIARLNGHPVVSAQVVKKSGENLLNATDKIFVLLDEAKKSGALPATMTVSITNDQSDIVRKQLSNLENSMILGIILVVLVLFYFLGTRNALFVGLAIPMSMLLSFTIFGIIGYKINMIVLFSLILALGMLVDNAIVVVDNIYRFVSNGYKPFEAARLATSEIALPIISSTATTLAAFLPLVFWEGIMGEFMKYMPVVLIITLTASLFVALVITPVVVATFIKAGSEDTFNAPDRRKTLRNIAIVAGVAILSYLAGWIAVGNILVLVAIILFGNMIFFWKVERWFRTVFLPWLEDYYSRALKFALRGKNPIYFLIGTIGLFFFTIVLFGIRQPEVKFFPSNDPNYIVVVAELPIGTDITATDSVMQMIERDIDTLLKPHRNIIESVLTTVGQGDPDDWQTFGPQVNKGNVTISFVEFKDRAGDNTSKIMQYLSSALLNKYPGVTIMLKQDEMGPPAGKQINLEIIGPEFDQLLALSDSVENHINRYNIAGIEGIKKDLDVGKPELIVNIDRDKARRFGLSTMQIAATIRTALYGTEVSKFKVGEDEYPIQLRFKDAYRYNLSTLLNQKISFMDNGKLIQIPVSSVAEFQYSTTYGSVKRKDKDRVITLSSSVIKGYNANNINAQLKKIMANFPLPEGYKYAFTGEQEEQQESMEFLGNAMLIALALIVLILVTQFNSLVRPLIIMTSVIFSTIGVLGGLSTFKMDFVVVMTGIGLVSLAGIVVNNAIVLIDYIGLLKERRRVELGLEEDVFLPVKDATDCVVQAGKTRLRPVLLTAITTVLGLVPMAIGLNIDFIKGLSEFNPDIYFGGDNVVMWAPISWTVIFGLTFSTFLTLIVVPVMYRITINMQKKFAKWTGQKHRVID